MHVTYIIIVIHVNEVKCNLTELTTRSHCCQWFRYICTWVRFLLLLVVVLIHWCGRKKEHLALFSLPSPLYFPLLISVMSAFPHGGVRAYGCIASHQYSLHLFFFFSNLLFNITEVYIAEDTYKRELAANSGSSRMSQAPNLHLATQLFY